MLENVTKLENRISFSLNEIAAMTSISVGMLRKEIRAGNLKVKRAGTRIVILKSDFMDYLNRDEDEK